MFKPRIMFIASLFLFAGACSDSGITNPGMSTSQMTVTGTGYRAVASIAVLPEHPQVQVGKPLILSFQYRATSVQDSTRHTRPTWSSSDTTIATISPSGILLGKKPGTVHVRATAGLAIGSVTAVVTPGPTARDTGTAHQSMRSPTVTSVMGDDFTSYTNTDALRARISSNIGGTASPQSALYTDGASVNLIELDSTVQYNGHATMKYVMPGGVNTTPRLSAAFPGGKTLTKMWYRVKIRFSPGFTTTGTLTHSANAYKMLGWGWRGPYGSGRVEITNTNQYDFYWDVMDKTTGKVTISGKHASAGRITSEWSDAGWYDYIVEVDFTPGTSGVTRIYMARDGQKPTLRATSIGTIRGGALPPLNLVALGLNFNQVRAVGQNQALWYGQWEVVDGSVYSDPFGVK